MTQVWGVSGGGGIEGAHAKPFRINACAGGREKGMGTWDAAKELLMGMVKLSHDGAGGGLGAR